MDKVRFGPPLTNAVKQLIIINVAVFLAEIVFLFGFKSSFLFDYFALSTEGIVQKLYIWQVFTYPFLHAPNNILHIFFNMFTLWMFGSELEARWGKRKFIQFYLVTGTLTGIIIFVFNYLMGYNFPTIGASGVVYAVMVAYAVYWGNRMIYIWMIFPIKVKYFVMILGFITYYLMITEGAPGISHIGHLGGIVTGYIYVKLFMDGSSSSSSSGSSIFNKFKSWKKKREWEKKAKERYDNMNTEQVLDEILAKISRTGLQSLSKNERELLKKASDKMNDNRKH